MSPPLAHGPAAPAAETAAESDKLVLDEQSLRDLEIFETETGNTTLFEFCNRTRSAGGAKALQGRMRNPWADGARIRATQEAVSFVIAQRRAFGMLPSLAYTTGRVERYRHDSLPVVMHENPLEFVVGAADLRLNHDRDYSKIVRGVQVACLLIRTLRTFVSQSELEVPEGEMGPLIAELKALLGRPRIGRVPDHEIGRSGFIRILRIDQILRLHEKNALDRLLELTYEIDAVVALADVTRDHALVLPDIADGPLHVYAKDLVHPLVPNAVANPVELDQERRILFLTGPNMAGKTTYLRAFATALYLAHLGMGVPARSFRFVPVQRLFTSISIVDNLRAGISYFRAEALRMKAIAGAVAEGHRVIALMDEPFKGTNVKDAFDASLAILERLESRRDCLFVFSSHLIELSEKLHRFDRVDCRHFEAEEAAGSLRFGYVLRPGVSAQRLGMRVLEEEGIFDLLDGTAERAEQAPPAQRFPEPLSSS